MPTSQYKCNICQHLFEHDHDLQGDRVECVQCGSTEVEKVAAPVVELKMSDDGGCPPNSPFS